LTASGARGHDSGNFPEVFMSKESVAMTLARWEQLLAA
jgi:hypothetical protein